ncbi:hypothetical protein COCOR_05781 [Corallococcus coralloides DSM 2259]|uniref:Lipoprotein n=1 Tax=Corallococcus coralloides (strain ATCC 25202 / DSM 2259 / NBRC 100086 / M2) TaxID=1144275 RepID=H8MGU8_CORCM|nr:hypothetical protein [Corallococcus coralloides]AFE06574.1 hypothetical protein COCOR_05781 [Corallococcus coralloides DSM 2259]
MKRLVLATLVALLGACFDPLYEDPDELGEESWAVCCVRNQVDTCLCEDPDGCEIRFQACSAGTCTASLRDSCETIPGSLDGGQTYDGGAGVDAGTTTDGGVIIEDGGTSTDAGTSTDGGTDAGVDAGTDAGVDAGTDAGPPPVVTYEPCCDPFTHRVTTCRCEATGCSSASFKPCASGRCALNGESCG